MTLSPVTAYQAYRGLYYVVTGRGTSCDLPHFWPSVDQISVYFLLISYLHGDTVLILISFHLLNPLVDKRKTAVNDLYPFEATYLDGGLVPMRQHPGMLHHFL